jgi:hypothetical protein
VYQVLQIILIFSKKKNNSYNKWSICTAKKLMESPPKVFPEFLTGKKKQRKESRGPV